MKTVAIVQARMGSTRLPDKVMKPIGGVPMIEVLLTRLARAREVDQIVVATSVDARNEPLADCVRQLGFACVQGDEQDVMAFVREDDANRLLVILNANDDPAKISVPVDGEWRQIFGASSGPPQDCVLSGISGAVYLHSKP